MPGDRSDMDYRLGGRRCSLPHLAVFFLLRSEDSGMACGSAASPRPTATTAAPGPSVP